MLLNHLNWSNPQARGLHLENTTLPCATCWPSGTACHPVLSCAASCCERTRTYYGRHAHPIFTGRPTWTQLTVCQALSHAQHACHGHKYVITGTYSGRHSLRHTSQPHTSSCTFTAPGRSPTHTHVQIHRHSHSHSHVHTPRLLILLLTECESC